MATRWDRLAVRGNRLVRDAEERLPQQRPPSMHLHLEATVPAWVLRLVALVLAAIASLLVTDTIVTSTLLLLASLTVALLPGVGLPVVVAGLIGWGLLTGEPSVLTGTLVVLCVHAFLVLTRLIGGVGWDAVVELRALRRVGGPFLVIQALAQVTMHLAFAMPAAGSWLVWAAVGAIAVLVVLTWALARSLRQMG